MKASVLTIAEAAADLATTPARVWKWHRDGRLEIIYLAGLAQGRRTGSKDGRIDRAEWERFKASLSVRVIEPFADEVPRIGPGRPTKKAASLPEAGSFLDRFERKAKAVQAAGREGVVRMPREVPEDQGKKSG